MAGTHAKGNSPGAADRGAEAPRARCVGRPLWHRSVDPEEIKRFGRACGAVVGPPRRLPPRSTR